MAILGRRQPIKPHYGLPQWVKYPAGNDVTVNLTGQSISALQGVLVPGIALALTGQVIPVAQGVITAGADVNVTLVGMAIHVAQGNVAGPVLQPPVHVTVSGGGRSVKVTGTGGR